MGDQEELPDDNIFIGDSQDPELQKAMSLELDEIPKFYSPIPEVSQIKLFQICENIFFRLQSIDKALEGESVQRKRDF